MTERMMPISYLLYDLFSAKEYNYRITPGVICNIRLRAQQVIRLRVLRMPNVPGDANEVSLTMRQFLSHFTFTSRSTANLTTLISQNTLPVFTSV